MVAAAAAASVRDDCQGTFFHYWDDGSRRPPAPLFPPLEEARCSHLGLVDDRLEIGCPARLVELF